MMGELITGDEAPHGLDRDVEPLGDRLEIVRCVDARRLVIGALVHRREPATPGKPPQQLAKTQECRTAKSAYGIDVVTCRSLAPTCLA